MRTSGLGRALRYFIGLAELYMLYIIIGSFALAAYVFLIDGNGFHLRAMLLVVPRMEICLTIILIFISGLGTWVNGYCIPIFFGCRRRDAFLGILAMDAVLIAESLILYKLMEAKFNPNGILLDLFEMPVLLAVFIFLEAVSRLVGAIAVKCGKLAYNLLMTVGMMAMVAVATIITFSTQANWNILGSFLNGNRKLAWQWMLLLASVMLGVVAHTVDWLILRRYEARL